ncbi:hypothetical protein [Synechococcus elongatus]|uniref:hypothetical protein n=1 Tax=Synechococcus elongatus TaxID=32046 RepID=UPI000F7EC190|nr:hypothetical protein [Synechococcus elongatus]
MANFTTLTQPCDSYQLKDGYVLESAHIDSAWGTAIYEWRITTPDGVIRTKRGDRRQLLRWLRHDVGAIATVLRRQSDGNYAYVPA